MHDQLIPQQRTAVEWPATAGEHRLLTGPAGAGKSTALARRIAYLLDQDVPGYSILVLLPDRQAREQTRDRLSHIVRRPHSDVELFTYYSLARRFVTLFWPLVARDAGFEHPERRPVFVTFELAQYLMHHIVEPLLEAGFFQGVSLRPARLISQLLDNLNRAAVNGYDYKAIGPRLRAGWPGDPAHRVYFDQAQACADAFRGLCLARGVLDISLTIEVFHQQLIEQPQFWRYFTERYRHLIADNLEEMVPTAHDLIRKLLPQTDSALLVRDTGAGFRYLLGVDPQGAEELGGLCDREIQLDASFTSTPEMLALARMTAGFLEVGGRRPTFGGDALPEIRPLGRPYRSEVIEAVAQEIGRLVGRGVPAGEIAVVAPYVDGVLRFTLREALASRDVPLRVERRYELLRDEPVVRTGLTLAVLAHPEWHLPPDAFDVAEALHLLIRYLDFLRASLLVRHAYDQQGGELRPADDLDPEVLERVGFLPIEDYEGIRAWLDARRYDETRSDLDHFLRRLFEEVIAAPGRLDHLPPGSADVFARLIASARHFRQEAPAIGVEEPLGRQYCQMVQGGVVAAQYLIEEPSEDGAVLLAPVYTYLLSGRHSRYQFWMDAGSIDWWRPPHQVLSNPFVLSRRWPAGQTWTEAVDYETRNRILSRLIQGLCHRCRDGIYVCTSDMESSGRTQGSSPLLRVMTQIQVMR